MERETRETRSNTTFAHSKREHSVCGHVAVHVARTAEGEDAVWLDAEDNRTRRDELRRRQARVRPDVSMRSPCDAISARSRRDLGAISAARLAHGLIVDLLDLSVREVRGHVLEGPRAEE